MRNNQQHPCIVTEIFLFYTPEGLFRFMRRSVALIAELVKVGHSGRVKGMTA